MTKYLLIPREDFATNVKVDVSKWVKSKQSLSYLPWNISIGLLRSYNPNLYYDFERGAEGYPYFKTETGVFLMAYLFDMETEKRTPPLFYPVRGFNNKGETNPDTALIGNAMQRAIAKAVAQYTGLGWSLYSKLDESIDFDDEQTFKPPAAAAKATGVGVRSSHYKQSENRDEDW